MISIIFCLIIFLEAILVLFLGTLLIAAVASAWDKAWAQHNYRYQVAPTMAEYRKAFAVEPDQVWLAV